MKYGIHSFLLSASCACLLLACELPVEDVGERQGTEQLSLDEQYELAVGAEKASLRGASHADREARIGELQGEFEIEPIEVARSALAHTSQQREQLEIIEREADELQSELASLPRPEAMARLAALHERAAQVRNSNIVHRAHSNECDDELLDLSGELASVRGAERADFVRGLRYRRGMNARCVTLLERLVDNQQRRQQYVERVEREIADPENPTGAEIRELERVKAELLGDSDEPIAPGPMHAEIVGDPAPATK